MIGHTKGPWFVDKRGHESHDKKICTIVGGDAIYGSGKAHAAWQVDANLIAAAPDLLEALEGVLSAIGGWGGDRSVLDAARAAIAKARGEK